MWEYHKFNSQFKHVKYDTLDKGDKERVDKIVLDMMANFKYIPIELGEELPTKLYNKIDSK